MKVSDIRREYALAGLSKEDLASDPVEQFGHWLAQAKGAESPDFTAMMLATADREGRPSARVVLLKEWDERGFVFFTNYESRKARDLAENPRASLAFYWAPLDRQVRIEGAVERTSREESLAYFRSRPRGAQLGAWASPQSQVVAGREELDRELEELAARFGEGEIPLPDSWGGFRLVPDEIEFWQGRPNRLHDRFRFLRRPDGGWSAPERLAP